MRVIVIVGIRICLWHEEGRFDCYDNFSPGNDGKEQTPKSRQLETICLCLPRIRPKTLGFDDLWEMDPEEVMRPACLALDEERKDWLVANAIEKYKSEEDALTCLRSRPKRAACQPPKPAES